MLQVSESLSKTYNMLPQRNVALKDALCAMLHDIDYLGGLCMGDDLDRGRKYKYRPNPMRSVHTNEVKILPYRPT